MLLWLGSCTIRAQPWQSFDSMSHGRSGEGQQFESSGGEHWASNTSSLDTRSAEWSDVLDPVERRKIQNKLAQQRFSECSPPSVSQQAVDIVQEPRPESRERTQNARQRIVGRPQVPTHLQKQLGSKTITHSRAFLGEGYLSNMS